FLRTFVWYTAWLQYVRPDAQPFVIVARDDSGNILGLAPLCRLRYRDLGYRLDGLAWAGREVVSGDFLDFLADRSARAEVLSAILSFLSGPRCRWSVLVLGELVDGSDSHRAVEQMGAGHRLPIRRQEERICPFIELPATFDDYLGRLGNSTRYHIRRRMRDVEKKGASVRVHSQPAEIDRKSTRL